MKQPITTRMAVRAGNRPCSIAKPMPATAKIAIEVPRLPDSTPSIQREALTMALPPSGCN